MTDTPWTPGPWTAQNLNDEDHWNRGQVWVTADDGRLIVPYTPADARLIAAAPRMALFLLDIAGAPVTAVGDEYRAKAAAILRDVRGDDVSS